jgi:hypothetical protein
MKKSLGLYDPDTIKVMQDLVIQSNGLNKHQSTQWPEAQISDIEKQRDDLLARLTEGGAQNNALHHMNESQGGDRLKRLKLLVSI